MPADGGKWVCTRCCRSLNLPSLSIRTRFGGEKCPLCKDPGAGMEFVSKTRLMQWDLSDV
jgi:hypothetical protein